LLALNSSISTPIPTLDRKAKASVFTISVGSQALSESLESYEAKANANAEAG
jgi:hypothetical protein